MSRKDYVRAAEMLDVANNGMRNDEEMALGLTARWRTAEAWDAFEGAPEVGSVWTLDGDPLRVTGVREILGGWQADWEWLTPHPPGYLNMLDETTWADAVLHGQLVSASQRGSSRKPCTSPARRSRPTS